MSALTMSLLSSERLVEGLSHDIVGENWVSDILIWFAYYATTTGRILMFLFAALGVTIVIYSAKFTWIKIRNFPSEEKIRTDYATRFERFVCWLPFTKSTAEQYQDLPGSFDDVTEVGDDTR